MSTASQTSPSSKGAASAAKTASPSALIKGYLFLYNAVSFSLWGYILVAAVYLLATKVLAGQLDSGLSTIYGVIFPTLLWTQTLAVLEIVHSVIGIVRASFVTTLLQVASRLVVVWAVLFSFGSDGYFVSGAANQPKAVIQPGGIGSYAFIGCVIAWSITECVRYSFFCMQVSGLKTPALIQWLRYNMFFVLYPIGIASECTLTYLSLGPAREVHELLAALFILILVIYVPGSYILYTHMMSQRRKVMRKHQKTQ